MGMIFYRYLARKVKKLGLSIKELDHQLEGIRVAFVHDKGSEKTNLVVEDMNSTQANSCIQTLLNLISLIACILTVRPFSDPTTVNSFNTSLPQVRYL